MSLALLLLPARSADPKESLFPFGRRGGIESGLLNAPSVSSLLLGFTSRLNCSLGSFRGRSLCGLFCASDDPHTGTAAELVGQAGKSLSGIDLPAEPLSCSALPTYRNRCWPTAEDP